MSAVMTTVPAARTEAASVSRRRRVGSWAAIWASTASARASEGVTSSEGESGPCSAWLRRSAATCAGSAVSSATTMTSVGPAGMSMAQESRTSSLAAVTQALPGPTILSTRVIDSVP